MKDITKVTLELRDMGDKKEWLLVVEGKGGWEEREWLFKVASVQVGKIVEQLREF